MRCPAQDTAGEKALSQQQPSRGNVGGLDFSRDDSCRRTLRYPQPGPARRFFHIEERMCRVGRVYRGFLNRKVVSISGGFNQKI